MEPISKDTPADMVSLIEGCRAFKPRDRPSMAYAVDVLTALLEPYVEEKARTDMVNLLALFQAALKEEADKLFAAGQQLEHNGRVEQALVHYASAAIKRSKAAITSLKDHVNTAFSLCCHASPDEIDKLLSDNPSPEGAGSSGIGIELL